MIRSLTIIPAMLCAAAIVAAQAPPQDKPAAPPAPSQEAARPPSQDKPAASTVTYTGCLKPGATPDSWVLESAEVGTGAAKPDTVGTSGAPKATLNLNAKPGTDLKTHANHRISVVGSIAPAKPGAAPGAKPNQEFAVESIKMVSATCP